MQARFSCVSIETGFTAPAWKGNAKLGASEELTHSTHTNCVLTPLSSHNGKKKKKKQSPSSLFPLLYLSFSLTPFLHFRSSLPHMIHLLPYQNRVHWRWGKCTLSLSASLCSSRVLSGFVFLLWTKVLSCSSTATTPLGDDAAAAAQWMLSACLLDTNTYLCLCKCDIFVQTFASHVTSGNLFSSARMLSTTLPLCVCVSLVKGVNPMGTQDGNKALFNTFFQLFGQHLQKKTIFFLFLISIVVDLLKRRVEQTFKRSSPLKEPGISSER